MIFSELLASLSRFPVILVLVIGTPVSLQASPADILLVNGKIFTANGSASMAQALAIERSRVAERQILLLLRKPAVIGPDCASLGRDDAENVAPYFLFCRTSNQTARLMMRPLMINW
jgi:hypothetical protein